MNKILKFLALMVLCSCNETTPNGEMPFLNITSQDTGLSITVENKNNKKASLIVNGSTIEKFNVSDETWIGDQYLKPGMNYLTLVSGADTIADSAFFSYKIGYQLMKEYRHDTANFTEGLFLEDNILYESTGLEGKSRIVKYKLGAQDLTFINDSKNDKAIFGEGIATIGNNLYQLTWQNHYVLVYNKNSLKRTSQFVYPNEGWGLTPNGDSLIASDGSATLFFISPVKFGIYKKLEVKGERGPVKNINELELVGNIVVANIWQTNTIVFINKETGIVLATADLTALANSASQENPKQDVLNGIAYDPADGTFIVTGKLWTKLYRIKLDAVWDKLSKGI